MRVNPAAAFDMADAGGKELARERAPSRDELVTLFEAMRQAKGFSVQNELTVKLQLLLAVRKGELQSRMVPQVCESALGEEMGKVKHALPHFTAHDFRRTARTHLAALGVGPHVAETCPNHSSRAWGASATGTTISRRGGGRWRRGGSSC